MKEENSHVEGIRQRKVISNDESSSNPTNEDDEDELLKTKQGELVQLGKMLALPMLMISLVFGILTYKYGIYIFMSQSMKEATLSEDQVKLAVANHTFLFVGGPHRGGTTILWECLREHPSISGFGDRVGADASEGIFMQTVFPRFGIGAEINSAKMATQQIRTLSMKGLGQYAFNPDAHMTEDHYLVTEPYRRKLFNQWAYFWDLSQPVLLEKSPPNMVYSRFIQAMFTPSLDPQLADSQTSARFVFITRHPLANAYAHKTWTACSSMTNFELVLHWLISHEILFEDMMHLKSFKFVKFEDFAQNPQETVNDIYEWIGYSPNPLSLEIKNNTNAKYEDIFCKELLANQSNLKKHLRLVSKLGERVFKIGYDLNDFGQCKVIDDNQIIFKDKTISVDIP